MNNLGTDHDHNNFGTYDNHYNNHITYMDYSDTLTMKPGYF